MSLCHTWCRSCVAWCRSDMTQLSSTTRNLVELNYTKSTLGVEDTLLQHTSTPNDMTHSLSSTTRNLLNVEQQRTALRVR